jgi:Fur family transcriptional regulator, ferric uptake regulator
MRESHEPESDDVESDDVESTAEAILDGLRADGGRVTIGRRAIVRSLLTADDHHVTADELAAMVQVDHPDVNRSTVYRTLDTLEELGVLTRVTLGTGGSVYHLADQAHDHLVCTRCGSVDEVPPGVLAPALDRLEAQSGFSLARSHVVVSGVCPACQAAAAATEQGRDDALASTADR